MQESPITFNPYQPPNTLLEANNENNQGLWQSARGDYLLVEHNASFPDRCVKCDQPAHQYRLKRYLYWMTPWVYLLFLVPSVGIFLFIIVGLFFQKKATIAVGLCEKHRRFRRNAIISGWLIFLISLPILSQAIVYSPHYSIPLILFVVTCTIISSIFSRIVVAKKITEDYTLLKGVSKAFISHFPIYDENR